MATKQKTVEKNSLNSPWAKYKERMGHRGRGDTIGLSKMTPAEKLPKPNVVRIEVLDGQARREYLGGMHGALDKLRDSMMTAIDDETKNGFKLYDPFFGIIDTTQGNDFQLALNATWKPAAAQTGFSLMSQVLTNNGNGGALGLIPFVGDAAAKMVNNAAGNVEQLAKSTMAYSGVNNSTTGSTTIKKFGGSRIDCPLNLRFTWYMPEQENMCRIGLKRLLTMAYVRPVNINGAEIVNAFLNGVDNAMSYGSEFYGDFFSTQLNENEARTPVTTNNDGEVVAKPSATQSDAGWLKRKIQEVSATGVNAYNKINTFFGGEITANPLPVRVTVGHYLDLEPMVIDNVNITFSQEQFISKDGTHLPVLVKAQVKLSYWMQPGPNKDFISILGNEVFEQNIDRSNGK